MPWPLWMFITASSPVRGAWPRLQLVPVCHKPPEEADDPDLSEEDIALSQSDVKPLFYDYLSRNLQDSQVIIMENTAPPLNLGEGSNIINFTKSEDFGRYGFFPIN